MPGGGTPHQPSCWCARSCWAQKRCGPLSGERVVGATLKSVEFGAMRGSPGGPSERQTWVGASSGPCGEGGRCGPPWAKVQESHLQRELWGPQAPVGGASLGPGPGGSGVPVLAVGAGHLWRA